MKGVTNSKHAFTRSRSSATSSCVDALMMNRNLELSGITTEGGWKLKAGTTSEHTIGSPVSALHDSVNALIRFDLLSQG